MSLSNHLTYPQVLQKFKSKTIKCEVCNKHRGYAKYRRHLVTHANNGEIPLQKVSKILFKVRLTRCDTKYKNSTKLQSGYRCNFRNELNIECKRIVLDIKRHLVSVHKLDKFSVKFEELVSEVVKQKPLKRHTKFSIKENMEMNNVVNSLNNSTIRSGQIPDDSLVCSSEFDYQSVTPHLNASPFEVSSGDEFDSETITSDDENCEDPVHSTQQPVPSILQLSSKGTIVTSNESNFRFIDRELIIREFQSFLLTKGGGGRRNTPVKGDMCQFRSVVNELGWHQLWDPNQLNHYVSSATCSPSTMYCRLRVYERFIHFLRMQIPSLLPTVEQLKGIDSMLCYLKEAIGKDRHLRTKHTMAVSRERMPKSFDVLRLWRSRRGLVEVKQQFVHIDEKTKDISEFVFRQLRNYLIVEILLANAQRSGIIEGMLIKEVLDAEGNAKCDNLVYIYVTNHKTGSLQAAIIYLDVEIYNYLVTMITIVLPLLPSISDISSRNEKNCHVFQTWTSGRLRTSSISSCLRSGLKLFGIHDPDGCPTNYRKAASTLISMHKPSMQESLSQFMCHARSTTERHYSHHISHRGLSSVFNELAKCQALPSNDDISTTSEKRLSNRSSTPTTQMVTHSDNVTEQINEPTSSNIVQDDHIVDSDNDLDDTLSGILHVSMDINSDSERSCLIGDSAFQYSKCTPSEISHVSVPSEPINDSRYTCKRNGKSIFVDQFQEDTFFSTFGNLIDNALHHIPVTASEVLVLSNTEQFFPLWTNLVNKFGQSLALKKVTDKIRTFARNNRVKK